MASTNSSTYTVQQAVNYARTVAAAIPTIGLAGQSNQPALTFANNVMQKIIAENNPWKWNSYVAPIFFSQPYQQDYPTNLSVNSMGWLESATFTDINNPAGTPQYFIKPPLQCVARLLPTYVVGIPNEIAWLMNRNATTGSWPGANMVYTNPLVSQGGGPGNNPLTAITDTNGNIQVVTTYGTTGSSAPSWPSANAQAGTTTADGTVVWTVQDPNGVCFRVNMLATYGSNVWQFNVTYQQKAPLITSLAQTFAPIPDDLQYLIQQGFLAFCYKNSTEADSRALFAAAYAEWIEDMQKALGQSDREVQSFGIYPADSLQNTGGGSGVGTYGYPGWWGWS